MSVEHFERLKPKIKSQTPRMHSGENIKVYKDCHHDLDVARKYDHHLTYHMVHAFASAGGDGPNAEDFPHPFRNIKEDLGEAFDEIRWKTYKDQKKCMIDNKLSVKYICDKAEAKYQSAPHKGQVTPRLRPKALL